MGYRIELYTGATDKQDAARLLAGRVEDGHIILPSEADVPDGEWVAFEIKLDDGEVVLEGMGRCEGSEPDEGEFEVLLGMLQFDMMNELMFERIELENGDSPATGEVDISDARMATPEPAAAAAVPASAAPIPAPAAPVRTPAANSPSLAPTGGVVAPPAPARVAHSSPSGIPPAARSMPRPAIPPPVKRAVLPPRRPATAPVSPSGAPAASTGSAPASVSWRPPAPVARGSVRPPSLSRSNASSRTSSAPPPPIEEPDSDAATKVAAIPEDATQTDVKIPARRSPPRTLLGTPTPLDPRTPAQAEAAEAEADAHDAEARDEEAAASPPDADPTGGVEVERDEEPAPNRRIELATAELSLAELAESDPAAAALLSPPSVTAQVVLAGDHGLTPEVRERLQELLPALRLAGVAAELDDAYDLVIATGLAAVEATFD